MYEFMPVLVSRLIVPTGGCFVLCSLHKTLSARKDSIGSLSGLKLPGLGYNRCGPGFSLRSVEKSLGDFHARAIPWNSARSLKP